MVNVYIQLPPDLRSISTVTILYTGVYKEQWVVVSIDTLDPLCGCRTPVSTANTAPEYHGINKRASICVIGVSLSVLNSGSSFCLQYYVHLGTN